MKIEVSAIEGPYLKDILDQPRSLDATLSSLDCPKELMVLAEKLNGGAFRAVILTGMGSSFHALHPLNLELVRHGFTSFMVETSELVHHQSRLLDRSILVIAVSQSGQSAEVLRLLEMNQGKAPVIAVTNTPNSTLAEKADAAIATAAGKEFSVSCKTYVTALMGLTWLGTFLVHGNMQNVRAELSDASRMVQIYLNDWERHVASFAGLLNEVRQIFLVGRGASLAAAGTGALIIKESDHFPAEGLSSASFRHGPFEMLRNGTFVLAFAGEHPTRELNEKLVRDIREQAGRAELVGEDTIPCCALPAAPVTLRPILEILPAQMITLALAAQVGREPGRFELARKVTSVE